MRREEVLTTVPELAARIGISRWALSRMLKSAGFQFTGTGRGRRVSIGRFARMFPEVWEALLEREAETGGPVSHAG